MPRLCPTSRTCIRCMETTRRSPRCSLPAWLTPASRRMRSLCFFHLPALTVRTAARYMSSASPTRAPISRSRHARCSAGCLRRCHPRSSPFFWAKRISMQPTSPARCRPFRPPLQAILILRACTANWAAPTWACTRTTRQSRSCDLQSRQTRTIAARCTRWARYWSSSRAGVTGPPSWSRRRPSRRTPGRQPSTWARRSSNSMTRPRQKSSCGFLQS